MAENQNNGKRLMKVSIEADGEFITTEVPQDSTVQALFDDGHLRGIETQAVRVNGIPATGETVLQPEDKVQNIPTGGQLA